MPEFDVKFEKTIKGVVRVNAQNKVDAMKLVEEKQLQPQEIFTGAKIKATSAEEVKEEVNNE